MDKTFMIGDETLDSKPVPLVVPYERQAVSVQYLDAVKGGAGHINLRMGELAEWLESRPGTLIQRLTVYKR